MADEDEVLDEGGLSAKKVVAGAALGVAVPAAIGVARKLMSGDDDQQDEPEQQDDDDEDASSEPTSRERKASPSRPKRTASSAAKATKRTTKKTTQKVDRSNRTREQLYKQATRLKIEGRSSMNKTQLERAIQRATGK